MCYVRFHLRFAADTLGYINTNPSQTDTTIQTLEYDDTEVQDDGPAPFRFLDLPPETRNSVYSYHFASTPNHKFAAPAVPFASKQLGTEALSVFFSDTNFHIQVGSNMQATYCVTQFANFAVVEEPVELRNRAGTFSTNDFIETNDQIALFRNLTLEVYDTMTIVTVDGALVDDPSDHPTDPLEPLEERHYHVLVDLQVRDGGALELTARDGRTHYRQYADSPNMGGANHAFARGQAQVVDDAVEKVKGVARDIAAKEGFKGFNLGDLRKVATASRLE